jgi:hypothetical protein
MESNRQPLQGVQCRQGRTTFDIGDYLLGNAAIFGQLSLAKASRFAQLPEGGPESIEAAALPADPQTHALE